MIRNRKILTTKIENPQNIKGKEGCIECGKKGNTVQNEQKNNSQQVQLGKFELIKSKNVHTRNYVEKIWKDETVFIIGGGPSLSSFDWSLLKGKKTIAINKSIFTYLRADILYWSDARFYTWYKNDIDKLKCKKYTFRTGKTLNEDIIVLNRGETYGLSELSDTLCHGNNSGYGAINLAYHLGVKNIVLLGYDMKNEGSVGHHHDGYPVHHTKDEIYKEHFIPGFTILAAALKSKGVNVYNASLNSDLQVWDKISFDDKIFY